MNQIQCMSGVELLIDYLEGQVPGATAGALEGHVAGCDRCQAFLASYRATPRIVREATDLVLPAGLQASLLGWLREQRDGQA
jgi:anti-sigma factor RsiW